MNLCVLLLLISALARQSHSASTNIDPAQRRQILQTPNGLQTLAQMSGGHVTLDADLNPGPVLYDLTSGAKASSLILNGTIKSLTSHLTQNGDGIATLYTIQPGQVLKGVAPGNITVEIEGGKYTFANGNTAEVDSLLTQHLKIGNSYIFFLNKAADAKSDDNTYSPVGNYQLIIDTSSTDIVPLVKYNPKGHFPLSAELSQFLVFTPNDLILRIQYILSQL